MSSRHSRISSSFPSPSNFLNTIQVKHNILDSVHGPEKTFEFGDQIHLIHLGFGEIVGLGGKIGAKGAADIDHRVRDPVFQPGEIHVSSYEQGAYLCIQAIITKRQEILLTIP